MQQTALLWHVSLLVAPERKALALGLVGLVRVLPIIGFSLFSGVAADVFDRRKLMLVTQLGGTAVAVVLAILAFAGLRTRLADLPDGRDRRGGRRVRSAVAARARAHARSAGASAERAQPQHRDRRRSPRSLGPAVGGQIISARQSGLDVRLQRRVLPLRRRRAPDDAQRAGDRSHRRKHARDEMSVAAATRRSAVRVPLADDPIDDAAGFLRDVLFVGDRAAADLRAGHPSRRRQGLRLAVVGLRRRGRRRQRGHGADRAPL